MNAWPVILLAAFAVAFMGDWVKSKPPDGPGAPPPILLIEDGRNRWRVLDMLGSPLTRQLLEEHQARKVTE